MQIRLAFAVLLLATADDAYALQARSNPDTVQVRRELEAAYRQNANAFERYDLEAIMALRAANFHTVTPDGVLRDRAAMAEYTEGFLHGIKKWNRLTFAIDSLRVVGDTAIAIVSQHLDRMALRPDNAVHRVETWVTQRESWVRTRGRWLLWRVDQLRNQRRLIDGKDGTRGRAHV